MSYQDAGPFGYRIADYDLPSRLAGRIGAVKTGLTVGQYWRRLRAGWEWSPDHLVWVRNGIKEKKYSGEL